MPLFGPANIGKGIPIPWPPAPPISLPQLPPIAIPGPGEPGDDSPAYKPPTISTGPAPSGEPKPPEEEEEEDEGEGEEGEDEEEDPALPDPEDFEVWPSGETWKNRGMGG